MNKLQEKAINAARTVLFNEFDYNANEIAPADMYVVWFCKTLQNWKALVSGVHIMHISRLHITVIKKKFILMYIKKLKTFV